MKLEDIVVNDELAALMPQLDDMEYMQLEKNILEAGEVTEALRVWGNVLIDGHNRYSILKNHPEIGYKVKKIEFANLDDAKMWIYKNQLGRRNLNKQQKTYYIGQQYLLEKELREKIVRNEHDEKGRFTVVPQNEAQRCSERTSEKIAKDNNVSRATVERAGTYVKGLEIAESIDPGFENKVLSGKVKVTQKQMMDIGQGGDKDTGRMLQKIRKANQQKEMGISKPKERRKVERKGSGLTKRIKAISEAMLHSEENPELTVEDMICEMGDALSDMIWRWKRCKVTYPNIISSEKGREAIEDLKKEIVSFLQEIENGELWK